MIYKLTYQYRTVRDKIRNLYIIICFVSKDMSTSNVRSNSLSTIPFPRLNIIT